MSAISVQVPIFILIVMAKLSNRPIGNFFFFCAAKYYLSACKIRVQSEVYDFDILRNKRMLGWFRSYCYRLILEMPP